MDITLVTCATLPEPDPDAEPLARALDAAGLRWGMLAWDAPDGTGGEPGALAIMRSTWNYPKDPDRFLAWVNGLARVTELWNPVEVICQTIHKSYLLRLAERGIPVAPTVLVPRGSHVTLAAICAEKGWRDVVIKPAVSAASFRTRRFPAPDKAAEAHLAALVAAGDVLVQKYLPAVEDYGERALVWIDGKVTHAVRKTPRFEGDDERVSTEAVVVSADEVALAERAMAAVASPLLYGRVDMAPGPDGRPVVMELELIEPSLFFRQCDEALDRFMAGIRNRLDRAPRASATPPIHNARPRQ